MSFRSCDIHVNSKDVGELLKGLRFMRVQGVVFEPVSWVVGLSR